MHLEVALQMYETAIFQDKLAHMEINGKTYNQMSTINILSRLISEPITYI